MVAALVCASFALILVLLAFVLWRKYFQVMEQRKRSGLNDLNGSCNQAAYYYLDDGPATTPPLNQLTWDGGGVVGNGGLNGLVGHTTNHLLHNNLTITVDDDSDFADSKTNKDYGLHAKGTSTFFLPSFSFNEPEFLPSSLSSIVRGFLIELGFLL